MAEIDQQTLMIIFEQSKPDCLNWDSCTEKNLPLKEWRNVKVNDDGRVIGLDLRVQSISKLPEEIGNLELLEDLSVELNELEDLPDSIGRLQNLKRLNLSRNKFKNVPSVIETLPKLEWFNISQNEITNVSPNLFQMSSLNTLNLWQNKLSSLPHCEYSSSLTKIGTTFNELRGYVPINILNMEIWKEWSIDHFIYDNNLFEGPFLNLIDNDKLLNLNLSNSNGNLNINGNYLININNLNLDRSVYPATDYESLIIEKEKKELFGDKSISIKFTQPFNLKCMVLNVPVGLYDPIVIVKFNKNTRLFIRARAQYEGSFISEFGLDTESGRLQQYLTIVPYTDKWVAVHLKCISLHKESEVVIDILGEQSAITADKSELIINSVHLVKRKPNWESIKTIFIGNKKQNNDGTFSNFSKLNFDVINLKLIPFLC